MTGPPVPLTYDQVVDLTVPTTPIKFFFETPSNMIRRYWFASIELKSGASPRVVTAIAHPVATPAALILGGLTPQDGITIGSADPAHLFPFLVVQGGAGPATTNVHPLQQFVDVPANGRIDVGVDGGIVPGLLSMVVGFEEFTVERLASQIGDFVTLKAQAGGVTWQRPGGRS